MQELKIHTEKEKQKLKVSVHLRTDAREATKGLFRQQFSTSMTKNQSLHIHSRFESQCILLEQ